MGPSAATKFSNYNFDIWWGELQGDAALQRDAVVGRQTQAGTRAGIVCRGAALHVDVLRTVDSFSLLLPIQV